MASEVGLQDAPLSRDSSPRRREVGRGLPADAFHPSLRSPSDHGELHLAALERALLEEPTAFDFFQAVHLLERLQPERAPLGGFGDPEHEAVRIGVNPRLGFPASEIQGLEAADGAQPRMTVNFTGLTGPSGVLPYPYATLLLERLAARDGALGAFFDLFHHRVASLFYAAWKKHRFSGRYGEEGLDPLTHHLRDLAGLGLETETAVGSVVADSLAAYGALLGPEPRSAIALEQLLADYFDVPCQVEQFAGGWYPVSAGDWCRLDEAVPASALGQGAVVGDEILDPQGAVRVRIGPLTRDQFQTFLPGGEAYDALETLLHLFSHRQFEFDVQLVLAAEELTGVVLGDLRLGDPISGDTTIASAQRAIVKEDEIGGFNVDRPIGIPRRRSTGGERLGWTTWIATRPRATDADETVLRM